LRCASGASITKDLLDFIDMRLAFVLRLGNDTRPAQGLFEGWVEEVDSSTEMRFRSAEELLKFLGRRFDLATASTGKAQEFDSKQPAMSKKNWQKDRKSPRTTKGEQT
jgi:hypothetical protein